MRSWLAACPLIWLGCASSAALVGCKERRPNAAALAPIASSSATGVVPAPGIGTARPVRPPPIELEKKLQQERLPLPPLSTHAPQLAFGKGVLGLLTQDALRVFDTADFQLLANLPLESPRAVLALADGSLLAMGARAMFRWEREQKRQAPLPRPVLLPGVELYADAQQADLLWTFDAGRPGGAGPATLQSFRLSPASVALLLPEQTIELTSPPAGVFGVSREGVWLYVTPSHAERFSPGGLRLSSLQLSVPVLPAWILPTRRLEQSLWVEESGRVSRVTVSPRYRHLASAQLPGRVLAADAGDDGRLLAAVVVTGAGPRFELALLDQGLVSLGQVVLPADQPTGTSDWVKVVTENQNVAVAPREARVAVGGPKRVTIFDGRGKLLFSIPSM